jgi:tRNA/rRNA methyltransferase
MEFSFILVEPARPANVGSAARAIKTMGFSSIRLVNPCDHFSTDARKLAYGSHDVLKGAAIFDNLENAISDLDFVIATTAKKRTVWNDYFTPGECIEIINKKGKTISKVGIVFGREESGLNTPELELCDLRSVIPLAAPYPSVNLAQSVMIYAYEFSKFNNLQTEQTKATVNISEQQVLKEKALDILERLEINRNPNLSRRMIERLMLAEEDDIHLFLSFYSFISRFLDDGNQKVTK